MDYQVLLGLSLSPATYEYRSCVFWGVAVSCQAFPPLHLLGCRLETDKRTNNRRGTANGNCTEEIERSGDTRRETKPTAASGAMKRYSGAEGNKQTQAKIQNKHRQTHTKRKKEEDDTNQGKMHTDGNIQKQTRKIQRQKQRRKGERRLS